MLSGKYVQLVAIMLQSCRKHGKIILMNIKLEQANERR